MVGSIFKEIRVISRSIRKGREVFACRMIGDEGIACNCVERAMMMTIQ